MILDTKSLIGDPVATTLARAFAEAGEPLYLVGGCVRDLLSGVEQDDWDFTTSARPEAIEQILSQFGTTWDAGKNFGTIAGLVLGHKVEVTTFRADTYDRKTRKPEVAFGDSLDDDLARRDFTINAMAINCIDGSFVDPFDGERDLAAAILRTPGPASPTILDDPLRGLRAVRFAATRGMRMDDDLAAAIDKNADALNMVSQERKTAELMKIAAYGPRALGNAALHSTFLQVYKHLFGDLTILGKAMWRDDFDLGDPLSNLAAMTVRTVDTEAMLRDMRFSKADAKLVGDIHRVARLFMDHPEREYEIRRVIRHYPDEVILTAQAIIQKRFELELPKVDHAIAERNWWRRPLSVNGDDLIAAGIEGRNIGEALAAAERIFLTDGNAVDWKHMLNVLVQGYK